MITVRNFSSRSPLQVFEQPVAGRYVQVPAASERSFHGWGSYLKVEWDGGTMDNNMEITMELVKRADAVES